MASTADSPWQAIISAALVGTGQQPFQGVIAPGKLGQVLTQIDQRSPEALLLVTAATIALHQQVGWQPETGAALAASPCSNEDLERCSPRATHFLHQILQGHYAQLLPEWLSLAAIARQRVPELHLPALLDKGRQQMALRGAILPVLGQCGRWLAAQNSDWSYAVNLANEAEWETGDLAARLSTLRDLRQRDPNCARALLQTTWSQEGASDRAKFLETLRIGLSSADEPFLAGTMSDLSKEVRRIAANLLTHLPDSHLCQQAVEHSHRYLSLQREPTVSIEVQLPEQFDPAWIPLGIEPKPWMAVDSKLGDRAWWLFQLIAATPLNVWTEAWQLTPQAIIEQTRSHEWQVVLLNGFAIAARRQHNDDWLEAIFRVYFAGKSASLREVVLIDGNVEDLFRSMSSDRQNALLIEQLQLSTKIGDSFIIWLLRYCSQQWSVDLSHLFLTCLEQHLNVAKPASNSDWELKAALKEYACLIPISLTSEFKKLRTQLTCDSHWWQAVEELLDLLQFRQDMYQSFAIEVERKLL